MGTKLESGWAIFDQGRYHWMKFMADLFIGAQEGKGANPTESDGG
jgi:hypothetical protein